MDPRQEALTVVDSLLARAKKGVSLSGAECLQLVETLPLVPGRVRHVAEALAEQQTPEAVDALLHLPGSVPGVIEGLYRAFAHGVVRRRVDGSAGIAMLALEFREAPRARDYPRLLAHAQAAFGDDLERLRVDGRGLLRFALWHQGGTLAGRVAVVAPDVQWIHRRVSRLRGSRLWLNGWAFSGESVAKGPAQSHLLQAWLGWAAKQTHTLRLVGTARHVAG